MAMAQTDWGQDKWLTLVRLAAAVIEAPPCIPQLRDSFLSIGLRRYPSLLSRRCMPRWRH